LHPKQKTGGRRLHPRTEDCIPEQKIASQNRRLHPGTEYCIPGTRNYLRQKTASQTRDCIPDRRLRVHPRLQYSMHLKAEDYILSKRLNPRQKTEYQLQQTLSHSADCIPSNRM
jgi:hypothetical protein